MKYVRLSAQSRAPSCAQLRTPSRGEPSAAPPSTPAQWFRHLFDAKAAKDGGIVRRKVRDMERMVGRDVFEQEIARRGFTAVENAGQVVVFSNAEPVLMTAARGKSSTRI